MRRRRFSQPAVANHKTPTSRISPSAPRHPEDPLRAWGHKLPWPQPASHGLGDPLGRAVARRRSCRKQPHCMGPRPAAYTGLALATDLC